MATLAITFTIGFVAQVISTGSVYKNLEGPIFGTRVGIYHMETLDSKPIPAKSSTKDQHGYRMIVYRLPSGAIEHSQSDDFPSNTSHDMVVTLPASVKRSISQTFVLPKSTNLPQLASIPEDFSEPSASVLPAERRSTPIFCEKN